MARYFLKIVTICFFDFFFDFSGTILGVLEKFSKTKIIFLFWIKKKFWILDLIYCRAQSRHLFPTARLCTAPDEIANKNLAMLAPRETLNSRRINRESLDPRSNLDADAHHAAQLWYKKPPAGSYAYHRFHFKSSRWCIEQLDIGGSMHGNCSAAGIRI